ARAGPDLHRVDRLLLRPRRLRAARGELRVLGAVRHAAGDDAAGLQHALRLAHLRPADPPDPLRDRPGVPRGAAAVARGAPRTPAGAARAAPRTPRRPRPR